MNTILDKIIKNKKREVRRSKEQVSLSKLLSVIQSLPVSRSFSQGLKHKNTVAIIAEVKKASPSAGILRHDFDPVSIAKSYEKNGASAISVLTEERFFEGNLEYLSQIKKAVQLPLLRKDFIIDPYQVLEARAHGADAVLLISGILSEKQCQELASAAKEFQLEPLVEVHTAGELEKALGYGFAVIGINNRNLHTFEVDLSTTERLLSTIPAEVLVVSESGISQRQDLERLGQPGVDAVLIGETLMRRADVGAALRQFVGVPKWPR